MGTQTQYLKLFEIEFICILSKDDIDHKKVNKRLLISNIKPTLIILLSVFSICL
jgi:hypothetical protein